MSYLYDNRSIIHRKDSLYTKTNTNTYRYKYGRWYSANTGALLVRRLLACEASSEGVVRQENVVPNTMGVGI